MGYFGVAVVVTLFHCVFPVVSLVAAPDILVGSVAESTPPLFSEGFEEESLSPEWFNGPTESLNFSVKGIVDASRAGIGSFSILKHEVGSLDGVYAKFSIIKPTVVSYWVRASDVTGDVGLVRVGNVVTATRKTPLVVFGLGPDGFMTIEFGRSEDLIPYEANVWYYVQLVLDWEARTTTAVVDGAQLITVPFQCSTCTDVTSLHLYNIDANVQAWWDSIVVSGSAQVNIEVALPATTTLASFMAVAVSFFPDVPANDDEGGVAPSCDTALSLAQAELASGPDALASGVWLGDEVLQGLSRFSALQSGHFAAVSCNFTNATTFETPTEDDVVVGVGVDYGDVIEVSEVVESNNFVVVATPPWYDPPVSVVQTDEVAVALSALLLVGGELRYYVEEEGDVVETPVCPDSTGQGGVGLSLRYEEAVCSGGGGEEGSVLGQQALATCVWTVVVQHTSRFHAVTCTGGRTQASAVVQSPTYYVQVSRPVMRYPSGLHLDTIVLWVWVGPSPLTANGGLDDDEDEEFRNVTLRYTLGDGSQAPPSCSFGTLVEHRFFSFEVYTSTSVKVVGCAPGKSPSEIANKWVPIMTLVYAVSACVLGVTAFITALLLLRLLLRLLVTGVIMAGRALWVWLRIDALLALRRGVKKFDDDPHLWEEGLELAPRNGSRHGGTRRSAV